MPDPNLQAATEPPLPDHATELVLVLAESFVEAVPNEFALSFLASVSDRLRQFDEGEVVPLALHTPARMRARRTAFEVLRRTLPCWVSLAHRSGT